MVMFYCSELGWQ